MYPTFAYNAVGGGGHATAEDLGNGLLRLVFDPQVSLGGEGEGNATAEDLGNGLLWLVSRYLSNPRSIWGRGGNATAEDLSTASHLPRFLPRMWGRKLSS